jgi:hypothetical protein
MSGETASLGAEAVQLLDVLTDRLTAARQRLGEPKGGDEASAAHPDEAPRPDPADGHGGDEVSAADPDGATAAGPCPHCGHDPANDQQRRQSQSCTSCPICAAQAMLRGERPEATAKLIDGALAVLQVLRGLVAGTTRPAADAAGEPAEGDATDDAEQSDEEPAVVDGVATRDAEARGSVVRIDIR